VAIDLSGRPLHERGYRGAQGVAPLKETLAAGCLLAWDEFGELRAAAARGEPVWLADPLCGSGTFLLEAGSILADLAPGRLRDAVDSTRRWGFVAWGGHDPTAWAALQREAEERAVAGLARLTGRLRLFGSDSGAIVREVRPGAVRLGLDVFVSTARRDLGDLYLGGDGEQPAGDGLVVTNPPYGARLGDVAGAEAVLRRLGAALRRRCPGRRVAVLAARGTERALDLPLDGATTVWNGALECRFVRAHVPEQGDTRRPASGVRNDELEAFRNRIAKNLGKLERWIAREGVEAYRLYDADIPQLAVAVDRYGDRVQIHEYEPPARVDPVRARERLAAITDALPALLGVSAAHVHVKVRRRQRQAAGEQYERLGAGGEEFAVREGPLRFLVNLTDRLDTGLYLDHRTTRRMVGELASGKRLLNLFGYTATATAQAIASGASATTTVDSSWTYLEWGQRNLALNRLVPSAPAAGTPHELVRADCLQWLQRTRDAWDVVFLDPPTHSRGALMAGPFDVQLDHPALLRLVRPRIAPGGVLVFSTHARGFRLGGELGDWARVEEVTHRTIPPDFRLAPRSAAVHRCFLLHAPA
jgi:23S rRNA (guanine2445-N2)-methyltransferase / 23S rRNA (guanine2069-N7)-methyltransferase